SGKWVSTGFSRKIPSLPTSILEDEATWITWMRLRDPTIDPSDMNQIINFNQWLLDMGDGRLPAVALDQEDEATWITILISTTRINQDRKWIPN
ncbi:hypothetical protein Tco_0467104, partial [Tanacetum coccineum]